MIISRGAFLGRLIGVTVSMLLVFGQAASAQSFTNQRQEQYVPTTWVDPDGCEHWVMDDGSEGFMAPKFTRDGYPVCNGGAPSQPAATCGRATDQYFRTDDYSISAAGRAQLQSFFRQNSGQQFIIVGHTDSRASDAYNNRLSLNRARSVAQIAQSVGANVVEIRGMGEREPIASNATVEGRAKNRRVDILCTNGRTPVARTQTSQPYVEPARTLRSTTARDSNTILMRLEPLKLASTGAAAGMCGPNGEIDASSYTGKVCGRLSNQYFATGKYDISAEGRSKLADFFQANPGQRFAIIGHTDSRSSDAYNMQLSLNRAKAVAVVGQVVGANIIDVRGMGERQPIASNDTEIGMAQNRRVDIICVE